MSSAELAALEARMARAKAGHFAPPESPVPKLDLAIAPSKDEEKLNKLERAWLTNLRACNYPLLWIQSITLKLGDDCRYTPDFVVLTPDGKLVAYETKGFMRDDALVKIKVAARQFPMIGFVVVRREKGVWHQTEVRG